MFQRPELILSNELSDLLFTDKDCSPIKSPFIHKKIRRDLSGNIIKCKCTYLNGNASGDLTCPYCYGDGYLFDEVIIEGFTYKDNYLRERYNLKMDSLAGYNDHDPLMLVTSGNVSINKLDRIYSVELDSNGRINIPLNITHKYTVYFNTKMKASQEKLDYNLTVIWD